MFIGDAYEGLLKCLIRKTGLNPPITDFEF